MAGRINLGLIGKPLGHSLSQKLFTAMAEARGLDISYELLELEKSELARFFDRFRTSAQLGLNVTIPYKEEVIRYLEETDETVKVIGAVNVIKNDAGHLWGFNTDWIGFKKTLGKINSQPRRTLIFGAGGACRAVIYSLGQIGCQKVFVAVRSVQKGTKLLKDFSPHLEIHLLPWGDERLPEVVSEVDVLVNATPVGMIGSDSGFQVLENQVLGGKIFIDLIYNPPLTDFMKVGLRAGAVVYNGVDMLLFQALEALKIWTGIDSSYEEWQRCYEFILSRGIFPAKGKKTFLADCD